jgi:ABC-2 type transport system ATP-binding protein
MSIVIKNLVKVYGTQHAVDDITFTAEKGKITGFLGPNGAGKSTTMKIATCYIPPTSGTVEVCGLDVVHHSIEVRKKIGYLPEHNPLYLDMYIKEYLTFIGGLYGLKSNVLNKRIEEMVELCGLSLEQHKKIGMLSKGYRQRVGLAQAILPNPEVLILDEPTTGLDPNQIIEIRKVIKSIAVDKTVIFSTHIMQEVQALCDHVVIINKGKLVANNAIQSIQQDAIQERKLIIEFASPADAEFLKQLPYVSAITSISNTRYQLSITNADDIRGEVANLCLQNGRVVVELKLEEVTMENIFRTMTNQ